MKKQRGKAVALPVYVIGVEQGGMQEMIALQSSERGFLIMGLCSHATSTDDFAKFCAKLKAQFPASTMVCKQVSVSLLEESGCVQRNGQFPVIKFHANWVTLGEDEQWRQAQSCYFAQVLSMCSGGLYNVIQNHASVLRTALPGSS